MEFEGKKISGKYSFLKIHKFYSTSVSSAFSRAVMLGVWGEQHRSGHCELYLVAASTYTHTYTHTKHTHTPTAGGDGGVSLVTKEGRKDPSLFPGYW